MNFGKQYGVEIYEGSLSGVCFSVFSIFFSPRGMDYHAPFLRIIFCSLPLDFLGLENAFPRTRSP